MARFRSTVGTVLRGKGSFEGISSRERARGSGDARAHARRRHDAGRRCDERTAAYAHQRQAAVAGVARLLDQLGRTGRFARPRRCAGDGRSASRRRPRQARHGFPAGRQGAGAPRGDRQRARAAARGASPARPAMPAVQHARLLVAPGRVQPERQRRLLRLRALRRRPGLRHRAGRHRLQRAGAQPDPEPGDAGPRARQQHAVGAGLQPGLLRQADLLDGGRDAAGAPGPQRRRRPARA